MEDRLVNAQEGAEIMGVDRSTFWRYRKQGLVVPTQEVSGRPAFSSSYLLKRRSELGRVKTSTAA